MSPKYFIKTYGCQMNRSDSEILAGLLEAEGYTPAENRESANVILINTCTVRENADRKAYGFLWELKKLSARGGKTKKPIIVVAGCLAESEKDNILKKFPFVDLVMGPGKIAQLSTLLEKKQIATTGKSGIPYSECLPVQRGGGPQAFVTAMFGCNQFCSFCIVPYVRGREMSRPIEAVVSEIQSLDKNIYKEVTLLGQKIEAYEFGLDKLLEKVNEIKGIERIRFLTSYPSDLTDAIIAAVADLAKVCEYFHLPIQSGDDEILKAMQRDYTVGEYRKLIEKIRAKVPRAAITTDMIVGFPGETEAQFKNSIEIIRELKFDGVNTAAYSPRKGTRAAQLADSLPQAGKRERLFEMNKIVEQIVLEKNKVWEGKVVEVLVAQAGLSDLGCCLGRTRTNKIVEFEGRAKVGDLVQVKIEQAKSWVLHGVRNNI